MLVKSYIIAPSKVNHATALTSTPMLLSLYNRNIFSKSSRLFILNRKPLSHWLKKNNKAFSISRINTCYLINKRTKDLFSRRCTFINTQIRAYSPTAYCLQDWVNIPQKWCHLIRYWNRKKKRCFSYKTFR